MEGEDHDERQCRFCYEGHDAEDDRLFRPCLCAGSQACVHESCLRAWRESALESSYFYECVVCHYRYRLRWIAVYHTLTHCALVTTLTPLCATAILVGVAYAVKAVALAARWGGAGDAWPSLQWEALYVLSWEPLFVAFLLTGLAALLVGLVNGELCPERAPRQHADDEPRGAGPGFDDSGDCGNCPKFYGRPDGMAACMVLVYFVMAIIGFAYLIVGIARRLRTRINAALRRAGNEVLEVKKRQ
jgi:hypothetical protein